MAIISKILIGRCSGYPLVDSLNVNQISSLGGLARLKKNCELGYSLGGVPNGALFVDEVADTSFSRTFLLDRFSTFDFLSEYGDLEYFTVLVSGLEGLYECGLAPMGDFEVVSAIKALQFKEIEPLAELCESNKGWLSKVLLKNHCISMLLNHNLHGYQVFFEGRAGKNGVKIFREIGLEFSTLDLIFFDEPVELSQLRFGLGRSVF
jgi:hypothetical protein